MDKAVMDRALNEAKAELSEVSAKAAKLKVKMDSLQEVIGGLEKLLGIKPTLDLTPANPAATGRNYSQGAESTWKLAQSVLAASGAPMAVPEIFAALEARDGASPAKDAIRIAMMRKPEIFKNVDGKYALVPDLSQLLDETEKGLPEVKGEIEKQMEASTSDW